MSKKLFFLVWDDDWGLEVSAFRTKNELKAFLEREKGVAFETTEDFSVYSVYEVNTCDATKVTITTNIVFT